MTWKHTARLSLAAGVVAALAALSTAFARRKQVASWVRHRSNARPDAPDTVCTHPRREFLLQ
jgi:hypothetical protein